MMTLPFSLNRAERYTLRIYGRIVAGWLAWIGAAVLVLLTLFRFLG